MSELLVLDRTRLDLITKGNATLAAELIGALVREATGILNRLVTTFEGHSSVSTADSAHHLKGMALELGAQRLSAAARALEGETHPERRRALISGAAEALDELRAFIEA